MKLSNILLFLVMIALMACPKKNDPEPVKTLVYKAGYMTGQIAGKSWEDTSNAFVSGNTLYISSTDYSNGFSRVTITLDDIAEGPYGSSASQPGCVVKYEDENGKEYLSTNAPGSASIYISKRDTVNWTYTGTVMGDLYASDGAHVRIKRGAFSKIPYWEANGGDGTANVPEVFSVDVDGNPGSWYVFQAYVRNGILVIYARLTAEDESIVISLPLKNPGTYPLSSTGPYKVHENYYYGEAQSGTLVITSHDYVNNIMSGTFSYTTLRDGDQMNFTNGSFTVVY